MMIIVRKEYASKNKINAEILIKIGSEEPSKNSEIGTAKIQRSPEKSMVVRVIDAKIVVQTVCLFSEFLT